MRRRTFLGMISGVAMASAVGAKALAAFVMPKPPKLYPLFGEGWLEMVRAMAEKDPALYAEVSTMPPWNGVVYWRSKYPEDFAGITPLSPISEAGSHLIES